MQYSRNFPRCTLQPHKESSHPRMVGAFAWCVNGLTVFSKF